MNALIKTFSDLQEAAEMSAESVSSHWLPIRPFPLTFIPAVRRMTSPVTKAGRGSDLFASA